MEHKLNGNTLEFVLAGDAIFTVLNTQTGGRFTFRVTQPSSDKPHFVKVLTGSDNEEDYTFLGTIFEGKDYRHGKRSPISQDAQSARAFGWVWPRLIAHTLPASVEVYHEGKCGRCGRTLTTPESITRGIGPDCLKKMETN